MQAAINQGIFQIPVDPSDIRAECRTNNCTFEQYSTLGICSRVDDVTTDVRRNCPSGNDGRSQGCNYTVKDLQAHPPWRPGDLTTGGPRTPQYSLWIGSSDIVSSMYDGYMYIFPNPNTLTEFYTLYISDTKVFSDDSDADFSDSVVALKGGLDLCIYQYNTTVINIATKTLEKARIPEFKCEI